MSEPITSHPVPEGTPGVEALLAQIAELQSQLARSEKIKKTLMERVERSMETAGNAYTLFERSILLEQSVSQRTIELKESETAYRTLFEQSPYVIILNKLSGEYIDVNERFCAFSGLTREQILGKTPTELGLITLEQTQDILQRMKENGGVLVDFEISRTTPKGRVCTELLSSRIIDFHGIPSVLSILQDITERKETDQALRESEARRRLLIETTATGYLILDAQGKVIDANSEYVRLTGSQNLEEIRGRSVLEWTAEHDKQKNAEAITQCLRDRYIRNFEVDYVGLGGKITPVEINATVEGEGSAVLILTLCRDITERKQTLEQIRLNEQRLDALVRLNGMADEPLNILCQFTMEEAVRLTGSTIGYLAFVSEDEKVMTMHAWSRSAMQECRIEDKPIIYPVEKTGLWGEAIRQRKPVITNDYSQPNPLKKGCPQGHVSVRRHMNAPIFDGDRIVIVAGVGNKTTDYDETDIRQLTLLMQGMWSIVQRKRTEETLLENLKRSQEQQQVVGQIAVCSDVADGNVEAAARRMTEQICGTANVQRAGVWQFNDDGSELRCVDLFDVVSGNHSDGAVLHRHQFCNEFEALETVQYVDAHDALTDPRTAGYVECYLKPLGITSMLDTAIRGGGKNLGILCIEHVGPARRWQQDEVVFACQLADQIALTLLNRQRRQYEETVRIERQRLASIIEGTHVGTWEWNVQTGETVFNERWAEIVGYTRAELEPTTVQTWTNLAHPEDLKISEDKLDKHFTGQSEGYDCECRMKHKNGSWVWVHDRGKVMEWTADGKPLRMFGTHSDITDRKRAEEALRESEQKARAFFDSSFGFIGLLTPDGTVLEINKTALDFAGIRMSDVEGKPFSDTIWWSHSSEMQELIRSCIQSAATGRLIHGEAIHLAPDGTHHTIDFTIKPVPDETGRVVRLIAEGHDITDRKRTEENLRKAMEAANAANVAKSQFLANMSHEIRTPMNAILGFAELLSQDNLTPQQSDFVQTIRNSGSHLLDLINDILDFSKIEAGKMTLEFTECSLETLLAELESLMVPFAQAKGLRFEMIKPTALPPTIRTDPVRLRQCLTNLVNNAIKFTETGHVIVRTIQTESTGKPFLRFEVEDTGPGIDPQVQCKIFEAFEQADGSMTRKYGGTGLGLTITRHLAELFGGSLTLTSEPGKGSTFVIAIPANTDIQNRTVQNRRNFPIPAETSESIPEQFQGRVLVAEDVKTNQVLIRILLSQVGLQPVIVDDGQTALEQVLRNDFDLILMDMQMPRLNGFEATRMLRKQGIRTPIVALTAAAIKGDEHKCHEAGCDEYLTKPIDRKKLLEILAQYLPAAAGLKSPV